MRVAYAFLFMVCVLSAMAEEAAWIEAKIVDTFGRPVDGVLADICCYSDPAHYFSCTYLGTANKEGILRSSCKFCLPGDEAYVSAYYGSNKYNSSPFIWHGYSRLPVPTGCYSHDPSFPHHTVEIQVETTDLQVEVYDDGKPLKGASVSVNCLGVPPVNSYGFTDENGKFLARSLPKYTDCTVSVYMFGKIDYRERMVFTEHKKFIRLGKEEFPLVIKLLDPYGDGLDGYAKIEEESFSTIVNITNGSGEEMLPEGNYSIRVFYFNLLVGEKKIFLKNTTEVLFVVNESNCEGVKNMECSNKGEYCYFGRFVKNCEKCGCPGGYLCNSHPEVYGGVCCKAGEYFDGQGCVPGEAKFSVFYVPLNRDYEDPGFLSVVTEQGEFVVKSYDIPIESIKIVDEHMVVTSDDCGFYNRIEPLSIDIHFKKWYAKKTGFIESLLYTNYRVVGYDKFNVCSTYACGYTLIGSSRAVYLSGLPCSEYFSVSAHEIGHTFGLCDTYNPNIWNFQNLLYSCPNRAPTPENSACVNCGQNEACCLGIRIRRHTYDIMGSADAYENSVRVNREFTDEEYEYIQSQLRWMR